MKARWIFSVAIGSAVLLGGALLATAAEPNAGQKQSAMPAPAAGIVRTSTLIGTAVLDSQGRKLGQIKDVPVDAQTGKATSVVLDATAPGAGQPMTYSAARPIDNAPPAPSLPSQPSMPAPCFVAPPCPCCCGSGWTQFLEDLYNE